MILRFQTLTALHAGSGATQAKLKADGSPPYGAGGTSLRRTARPVFSELIPHRVSGAATAVLSKISM